MSGQWITSNGKLTVLGEQSRSKWVFVGIDGPDWTNYRISAEVEISYPYSANQGQVAIVVRMGDSPDILAFIVDYFMRAEWATIGGEYGYGINYLAGQGAYVDPKLNIEVEANGNDFSARVDGRPFQSLSISGYERGGIAVGAVCGSDKCPTFDNVEITPLP